jgi:hypothetical protein
MTLILEITAGILLACGIVAVLHDSFCSPNDTWLGNLI